MDQKTSILAVESRAPFLIGGVRVDPMRNLIESAAGTTTVEPKIMAVLLVLARHANEVVTRKQLIDAVWGIEFGGDESLTRAICRLRKALGDGRGASASIETIPKRGYRLVARPEDGAREEAVADARAEPDRRLIARAALAGAALLAVLCLLVASRPASSPPLAGKRGEIVLAVLPFDNLGDDPADQKIADGLADDVLASLTRSRDFSVIAGGSSFRLRGADKDPARAAKSLGATHVVDGALRREGGRIRVNIYLVDARTKIVLWSTHEDEAAADIFKVRRTIAAGVMAAFGAGGLRANAQEAPDAAAYEYYLQGRALLRDAAPESLVRAVDYLAEAVRIDPGFADAWATLAMARLNFAPFLLKDPPGEIEAAQEAAARALSLDPQSADAILAQAIADYRIDAVPISVSERRFRDALEREPNNANFNLRMGMLMVEVGRLREGLEFHRRAKELDPLSAIAVGSLAGRLFDLARFEEAERVASFYEQRWTVDPSMMWTMRYKRWMSEGRYEDAAAEAGPTATIAALPDSSEKRVRDVLIRAALGARAPNGLSRAGVKDELIAAADRGDIRHFFAFELLAAMGLTEDAYELALKRIREGDRWFRSVIFRFDVKSLRREPRVMRLFKENGLVNYWIETGNWPDFCAEEALPYDCRAAAAPLAEER